MLPAGDAQAGQPRVAGFSLVIGRVDLDLPMSWVGVDPAHLETGAPCRADPEVSHDLPIRTGEVIMELRVQHFERVTPDTPAIDGYAHLISLSKKDTKEMLHIVMCFLQVVTRNPALSLMLLRK